MTPPSNDLDALRAQDLLAQRATEGLDEREAAELERLGGEDVITFDLAAAAIALATLPYEDLPASLSDKILAAAPSARTGASSGSTVPMTAPAVPAVAADLPLPIGPRRAARASIPAAGAPPARPRRSAIAGWSVAAAATAFAAAAWLWGPRRAAPPAPPVSQARLVEAASDAVTAPWRASGDASGRDATGELVWSDARQRGVARIAGLPANDPTTERYQLWIFDEARDERYPVHGALFDAATSGTTVVEVAPQVPIVRAVRFLVTIEPAAGVVVSRRDRPVVSAVISSGP